MKSKEKTVKIYIPTKNKADRERYVCVNGRSALIRTGEYVEVPKIFADVIKESMRADREAERYIMEKSDAS